jgi:hypothetical protein
LVELDWAYSRTAAIKVLITPLMYAGLKIGQPFLSPTAASASITSSFPLQIYASPEEAFIESRTHLS